MVSFGLKKVAIFGLMSLALCAQDAAFARKATPPQPPIEKAELEANLPAPLAKAAKDFKIPLSAMAISVRALDGSAKPILSVNGQHPVAPASTEKLITTLAALELLGPDYHWITRFFADKRPENDHIGTLYMQGGGDPTWTIEQFQLEVERLAAHGITHIDGDFVVDRGLFNLPEGDPDAFDGKGTRPYNQFPDAALVNYNNTSFEFVPDETQNVAHVITVPTLAGVAVPASIPLGKGKCGDWKGFHVKATENGQKEVVFEGDYPSACGPKVYNMVSFNKNEFLERTFRALWEKDGRTWSGHVVEGKIPEKAEQIMVHVSQPLREVVALTNKWSNNQIARHLFLSTAAASGLPGLKAYDLPTSRATIMSWLQTLGVNTQGFVLDNGSGLSRTSRVTADGMAQMLVAGWSSPYMSEYMSSLPISGVDGTMRKRKTAKTYAHMKTGYLENVRAIGGYVQTKSGKRYAVFATVHDGQAVWQGIPFLDRVIEWVHELP